MRYQVCVAVLVAVVGLTIGDKSETSHNYLSDFYSTFDSPHQSAADPDPDGDGAYAYYPVEPYHYGYQHHQPQGLFGAIDRQSFADDPSALIGIAALGIVGVGVVAGFATANQLDTLRNDINSNDNDISALDSRMDSACTALTRIGAITAATADPAMLALRVNEIRAAAQGLSCTG